MFWLKSSQYVTYSHSSPCSMASIFAILNGACLIFAVARNVTVVLFPRKDVLEFHFQHFVWTLTVVEREEEFMLRKKHDTRGELFGREPEPVVSDACIASLSHPHPAQAHATADVNFAPELDVLANSNTGNGPSPIGTGIAII